MSTLPILTISQGHLTLLEACPRKFQSVYLESLSVPATPEQQEKATWGSQFHRLMQQHALGLPIDRMAEADLEMAACVQALQQSAPQLFTALPATSSTKRYSEHQSTLAFNGYLLTVIYDGLILSPERGQIFDWKTYAPPPSAAALALDWQTRLYCYVLAETSGLPPAQVSMTYWFVRHRDPQTQALQPTAYDLPYTLEQHDQTRTALLKLTDQLTTLRHSGNPFPKVDIAKGLCQACVFAGRCQRSQASLDLDPAAQMTQTVSELLAVNLQAIDEVVL